MDSEVSTSPAPFRYDGGAAVSQEPIWLDPAQKKPLAILTSSLSPLLLSHERTVLHSRVLAMHPRRRSRQAFLSAEFGEPVRLGTWDITLWPAGFSPGSSQVQIEIEGRRWLFVGPFSLRTGHASEGLEVRRVHDLAVDLDWVLPTPHAVRRETVVSRVLARLQEIGDEGRVPVLYTPVAGIPQELILGLPDTAPRFLVHPSIHVGLQAMRRAGYDVPRKVSLLKRSHAAPDQVIVLPESQVGALTPGETYGTVGFRAMSGIEHVFPPFNQPGIDELEALIEAVAPRSLTYFVRSVGRWRERAPRPAGVDVRVFEKEAQMSLLPS